ncbi:MAG: undecaprenyl/decaprenyl-phosphate alpha-N-acetylglucosaminyl 1-phosphate transferase [Actinobacteria bacterium]|nr:undecaprenyl/decaprenyl-phosphate alpha-N-acetylglucosaminyl 1-phosphate transferase [Actinomycetota bacterium]
MREYLLTLLIAATLCYLVTPFIQKLAIRWRVVAGIRDRDIHTEITPRWGGVAMWIALGLTLLIVRDLHLVGKAYGRELQGIFLAATFVVLLGALDDRFELDAVTKLAGQGLAAGILLIHGIQILWLPINGILIIPSNIGQLLTVLIVMVTINAVNFIDGLDGLAVGVVAIASGCFFAFAYLLAVTNGFTRAGAPSLMTVILIGLCIGFLPHNSNPARMFMGDSGSMLLGLILAASAITLTGQIDGNALSAESIGPSLLPLFLPFAVLAIPLLDLGLAILRRTSSGKSPFAPDKLHLHHRLLASGNSQNRTAIVLYLWTATFAVPVTVAAFAPIWIAFLVAIFLAGTAFYARKRTLDQNGNLLNV